MADDQPKSFNSENQLVGSKKYSCARKRPRRVDVRPPDRYQFEDIVGHALQGCRGSGYLRGVYLQRSYFKLCVWEMVCCNGRGDGVS